MAEATLLEMTQNILASLDSDQVNSISDTVESDQVARIIQNKYYDILSRDNIPEQQMLMQLTASGDSTKPTLMYVPDGVTTIEWLKYFDANPADGLDVSQFGAFSHGLNLDIEDSSGWATTSTTSNSIATGSKTFTVASSGLDISVGDGALAQSGTMAMFGLVTSYSGTTLVINVSQTVGSGTLASWTIVSSTSDSTPGYRYVTILPIEQFLGMINKFNPSETNVSSFTFTEGGNNFTFYFKNDAQPTYCTFIENYYVIFDSYDEDFDSTLQASKTLMFGSKVTPFVLSDSHVPDLDDNQFPLLLNESKALAFYELKQTPHAKAEQEIKRQWSTVQKKKAVVNKPTYFDQLPNFGRYPRSFTGSNSPNRWMREGP